MAVYYRYRSGVETFSVPVPSPSISVADLKRLIMATTRHGHGRTRGRGPRESVALSDARTGQEYADDGALVPRNSTVLVRRVAAGPPAETISVAPPPPRPPSPKATCDGASSGSSAEDDDEARAISAVIDAAQLRWEGHCPSQGGRCHDGRRGALAGAGRTPPAGYVCHRCRVAGHFIQHCPTNGDPRFDLARTSPSASTLPAPAPAPASPVPDDGVPPELHCKICKKVMADAVVASACCFGSFCDTCIRGHLAAESKCVCGAQARADDLIPNLTLRAAIASVLASRTAGGADNQKSSVGSNAGPSTPRRPATSQDSRSHVTAATGSEHSDGSASSASTSAALPAAREPRRKQATAEPAQIAGYAGQYGHGAPFVGPACYDPFFGGMPCASDPYAYYGVPYGGGYPVFPVPAGYHDGGHGRKRTADRWREVEPGCKRRCGSRILVAA